MFMATRFNILCIDGPDTYLPEMQIALLRAGHQVNIAMGGTNALHVLREMPSVDVLLINNQLPDMTGIDLITRINNQSTFAGLGLILYSLDDVLTLPVTHPAWPRVDVCLQAPFPPAELYDAIFEAYTRRRGYLYRVY